MAPKRNPYTAKEEEQMWNFVASELRRGNEEAHRRSTTKLWAEYKKRYPDSEKNPTGLDTHYRRQMIPRAYEADVTKRDLFVLMRLHRTRISECHKDRLQTKFHVDIETNTFGEFNMARSIGDDPPKCFPTASERKKIFNEEVEDGEQEEEDEEELDEDAEGGGGFDIIDDDGDDEGEQRLDERHQELAPETPPNVPVFPAATARAPTVRATRRDEREPTEEELMFAESERVEPKRRHHPNASGQQQQQQTAAKKRRVDSTDERSASNHGSGTPLPQVRDIDEEERRLRAQPSRDHDRSEESQVLVKRRVPQAVDEPAMSKFTDVFDLSKPSFSTVAMRLASPKPKQHDRAGMMGDGGSARKVLIYQEDQDSIPSPTTSNGRNESTGGDDSSRSEEGKKMCHLM